MQLRKSNYMCKGNTHAVAVVFWRHVLAMQALQQQQHQQQQHKLKRLLLGATGGGGQVMACLFAARRAFASANGSAVNR